MKYNTKNLETIYKNIIYYKSNIYNQHNILLLYRKKNNLIEYHEHIIDKLYIINKKLLKNKDKDLIEKKIELTYQKLNIDHSLWLIEKEEKIIMNAFKIHKYNILNKIKRLAHIIS